MVMITWYSFDIIRGMHSHHLCIDAHTILPVRVEGLRQLHEGQRWCYVGVKVAFEGVGALVNVEVISCLHFEQVGGIVSGQKPILSKGFC